MRVGGCNARPSSFIISTITYNVVVYTPAERADTFRLFLLYPYINSVVGSVVTVSTKGLLEGLVERVLGTGVNSSRSLLCGKFKICQNIFTRVSDTGDYPCEKT
jgi:hypothetical protein